MGVIVFSGHSMEVALLGTFDGGNKLLGTIMHLYTEYFASYSGTRDTRNTHWG